MSCDVDAPVDVLVLSPHLDDAALSCGGYLHRLTSAEKQRVVVVNVFTGEPDDEGALPASVQALHAGWRQAGGFTGSVLAHRRLEEAAACRRLGVEMCCLDALDAAYRLDAHGKPLYDPLSAVLGPPHRADEALVGRLVERLRELPAAATWLIPMAVGHHVDHVAVRQAAQRFVVRQAAQRFVVRQAAQRAVADGIGGGPVKVLFYEDFPYARSRWVRFKAQYFDEPWRGAHRWRREFKPLRPVDLDAKVEAIACHGSQLRGAFRDAADMARQVRRFSARGERLWRDASLTPAP